MAYQLSGSPEADDQLPSHVASFRPEANEGSTKQNPRKDTSASTSSETSQQLSHPHEQRRTYTKAKDGPPRAGRASVSSASSLGVPRLERGFSRSNTRSPSFEYRETLNAKSEDLDDGSRIINQYKMTDVIGQGSYGTVHKATLTDDPETHFAIKEFGKTRLRKNNRYSKMRRPRGGGPSQAAGEDSKDPLALIRHEIAILKKLHHPNVVRLFEVLDDPSKDGLYLVFDYCPDGTLIDIKLNKSVEPLAEDLARFYFIQILLGVEYLHENDVVHRDIKPDNILLADDGNLCRIVDFGVSEMFIKPGDDTMQKSAGSPAFMSPELCTAGHQSYHGKKDDMWSFGVTLYCMVVGHLPFNRDNFLELYEAIKNDEPEYPEHLSANLKDLLQKMLAKDPQKRITIPEIRQHPWVLEAEDGTLVSKEENLQALVSEVTEEELDCAICKITNIFTFARAVSRFKKGGSMAREKREATRSQSGGSQGSDRDRSWFPPSPAVRAFTTEPDATGTPRKDGVETLSKLEEEEDVPPSPANVVDAAKSMFKDSLKQDTELAHQEADASGPLQRVKTAPVASLHPTDEQSSGQTDASADKAATPEMVSSPVSEAAPAGDSESIAQGEEAKHASSDGKDDTHGVEKMVKRMAAILTGNADRAEQEPEQSSHKESHDKDQPKLLPDQPTMVSPRQEDVKTPPGASQAYVQGVHTHDGSYFNKT